MNELYQKVFLTYGYDNQLNMVIEECAELIKSINKMRRNDSGVKLVIEEMVDVQILLEQFYQFFPASVWEEIKKRKLERLSERVKDNDRDYKTA